MSPVEIFLITKPLVVTNSDKENRSLKNVIHQIGSKKEWLLFFSGQSLGWFLSQGYNYSLI